MTFHLGTLSKVINLRQYKSPCYQLKKMPNLEVEDYVLLGRHTEELSSGDSLSESSEGLFWRGKGGTRIYRSLGNKNQVAGTSKDYCYLKKKQISQVNEFSAFEGGGDERVWAHWNHSFDMHLNCLGPVSCFLHPESTQGTPLEAAAVADSNNILCLLKWPVTVLRPQSPQGLSWEKHKWLSTTLTHLLFFCLLPESHSDQLHVINSALEY